MPRASHLTRFLGLVTPPTNLITSCSIRSSWKPGEIVFSHDSLSYLCRSRAIDLPWQWQHRSWHILLYVVDQSNTINTWRIWWLCRALRYYSIKFRVFPTRPHGQDLSSKNEQLEHSTTCNRVSLVNLLLLSLSWLEGWLFDVARDAFS